MRKSLFCFFIIVTTICKAQHFNYRIIDEANYSIADNITPAANGFLHFDVGVNKKVSINGIGLNKLRMGVTINHLDTSLKLISSKEFMNGERKLLPGLYNIFKFQNLHCIAYQDVKDEEYLGSVKLAVIDEATLEPKSETVLLDFAKYKLAFETKSVIKNDMTTYKVQVSRGQKMLLSLTEPPTEKDDRKQVFITVVDNDLKMVMERKIVFKEDIVRIYSYVCDDNGNVYISYAGWEDSGDKTKKGEVIDDGRKIIILRPQINDNIILPIELGGFTVNYSSLVHSPAQNKVFLVGAFSRGWDENHLGVFHASIDIQTFKLSKLVKTDFSAELVKKFEDDGYANSKEKKFGLDRYFSGGYVVRGDGTVDMLMTYNKADKPVMDSRGHMRSGSYYAGNILDAHVVNDKVIFSRIPRDMTSGGTSVYLNFTTFSNDENLILLYNESETNIEKSIDEKSRFSVVQKSEVCAATISSDGKVKRELLLKGYQAKTVGLLNRIYSIAPDSFFILLQKLNFASMSTADTKYARIRVD